MSDNRKQDIIYIKQWMQKESQLPDAFGDEVILKFLHSCYYSLEQTKKCIERFCTSRHDMSNIYTQRDPLAPAVTTDSGSKLFWNFHGANFECEKSELLIFKLGEDINKFNYLDIAKGISVKVDYWVLAERFLAEGHVIVLDLENFTMKHIPKINPMVLKEFVMYLLEGTPVRVKKVFAINAPPASDVLYNIIKPVLPLEIREIIVISSDISCLVKYAGKEYLPKEYGGSCESLEEKSNKWIDEITNKYSKMFSDENLWKGDATKRSKKAAINSMNGSFRTLDID